MGNTAEFAFGEQVRVTEGDYAGQVAEVEEFFDSPDGGHYYVYVGAVFTAVPAKAVERL